MTAVRQGVILAAGRGSRLRPLSEMTPKPLHPVCNKPIMQYQIEAMREAGVTQIAIVVGPAGQLISDCFGSGADLGVTITYIEDPQPAGIAASLSWAKPWVSGPFAVFLGDIFLSIDDLRPALQPLEQGAAGTIVVRSDTPEAVRRNFAVMTDADGRVLQVIEKPTEPRTDQKGCGVYVFDQSIFEAIARTPRSTLRNEYEITDAVQILVDFGQPVYASRVVRWDVNITFPEDLLACNLRVLRERYQSSLIGVGARISHQTQLHSSIIGDRAVVDGPVVLEECLVLPDVHVAALDGLMQRRIFARGLPAVGLALPSLGG